ncbi:MAG: XdhC family protein [Pirellulales bacterium]
MRETIEQLIQDHNAGTALALCRLVETRGSTPQKAGATMLVYADGSQAGTLGGGCVEAEVKRKSLLIIENKVAQFETFLLDNDYGWDDGLICGGRMVILIDPISPNDDISYFQRLIECDIAGQSITEAIVTPAADESLRVGSTWLINQNGQLLSSRFSRFSQSADAPQSSDDLPDVIQERYRSQSKQRTPWHQDGISFLPRQSRARLVIVGGGHIGEAVARLASDVEFDAWVIDDREQYVTETRFPTAQRRICGSMEEVLPSIEITQETYCLIVTRGHNHDEEALYHLIDHGAAYVGMIGSKRKIQLIFEDLIEQGISEESLSSVYSPVGIDIGSKTVSEIAISIIAELIAHRNRDGVIPGREQGASAAIQPARHS